ncbi:exported hypothetical protein [Vibrio coralliirubri]|uniref:hypothetical protein n=1 Tax=Vibrio coralliirubri TaxID=1516159 RepID=UPI000630038A|nr:hypothetical protein [Vibrio coralliirubri]CDT82821.1 exported hypothetical protein [Vibrio coralliirubri]
MKVLTCFILMLMPLASADAYESNVSIFTNIIKNSNSTKIAIEFDKNVYTTVYRTDDEKFDDVNMPFRVISPSAVTQQYNLTLLDSYHECDGNTINVDSQIDGMLMSKGDVNDHLDFISANLSEQWTDHRLTLTYPKITQSSSAQQCLGNIMISVELDI